MLLEYSGISRQGQPKFDGAIPPMSIRRLLRFVDGHIKVDGERLATLLRNKPRRVDIPLAELRLVFEGLGILAAHAYGQGDISRSVGEWAAGISERRMAAILLLSRIGYADSRNNPVTQTGLAELIFAGKTLETNLLELAMTGLEHWGGDPWGRHGICFLFRITLFRFRQAVYAPLWHTGLLSHSAPWLLKVIREELGMGADAAVLPLRMARSRLAPFCALGLASMFAAAQRSAGATTLATASGWLRNAGISDTDSAWLLSYLSAHLLSRMPPNSSPADMQQLLSSLAAQWPQTELTDTQIDNVALAFWRDPRQLGELTHKLRAGNDTRSLLRVATRSISINLNLCEDISEAETARAGSLNKNEIASNVTLLATLLLKMDELLNKPAGREAAIAVGVPLKLRNTFLSSPYIASRQPATWQQEATRALISVNVLLAVLNQTPLGKQSTQDPLIRPTLEEATRLFEVLGEHTDKLDLSGLPENIMLALCQFERPRWNRAERTQAYMQNNALPVLLRAFAAWAQPDVTRFDVAQAEGLFARAARTVVYGRNHRLGEATLIAWLDLSSSFALIRGQEELLALIERLWSNIPQHHRMNFPLLPGNFTDIGSVVCQAARGDTQAIGLLKANNRWSSSLLVRVLDTHAAAPPSNGPC
ncbi:hypothetical protein [Burkholderia ambifaria]|uniref:hypothetical protein n=1 Tax=Burkholderia ambifaria TaxID=152480 RepID=UPI00158EE4C0|nr:hypothetical protein [Burkholderia ambifaria]